MSTEFYHARKTDSLQTNKQTKNVFYHQMHDWSQKLFRNYQVPSETTSAQK